MRPGERKVALSESRKTPKPPEQLEKRPPITPKPRSLPERESRRRVSARRRVDEVPPRARSGGRRRSRGANHGGLRMLVPLAFLLLGGILSYLLLSYFNPPAKISPELGDGPVVDPPSAPASEPSDFSSENRGTGPPSPVPPPGVASSRSREIEVPADGQLRAGRFLEGFLNTATLTERIGDFEPRYREDDLEGGALDGEFPRVISVIPDSVDRNPAEDFIDYPFRVIVHNVDGDEGETREIMVLVRKRGDGGFKVVAPPLIQFLEKRLESFAAAPREGEARMFAVVEAIPRCFEPEIPAGEDKFTYKLSSSNRGVELARAYASKFSPLAEQVHDPMTDIRWGKRMRATVVLWWNTEEDPEAPYLEVVEVTSLDWNP